MSTWAFDPPCSMEPVPAIPDGDWYSDTSVPGPPEMIEACLEVNLPPLPDPPVCPNILRVVEATTRAVDMGQQYITMSVSEREDCTYAFALDAAFPVVCPTFPATATPAGASVVAAGAQGASLRAVSAGPACAFDFDLRVDFPCPKPPAVKKAAGRFVRPGDDRLALAFAQGDPGDCSCSAEAEVAVQRPGGLMGRVLSGVGPLWNVRVYPDGPDSSVSTWDTSIDVPGLPEAWAAPVGAWIAPIMSFAPFGQFPSGSELFYALSTFFGLELGYTSPAGIGKRVGSTPGSADVQLVDLTLAGGTSQSPGETATVYNIFGADIRPNRYVIIGRIAGYRFVIAEDCAATP